MVLVYLLLTAATAISATNGEIIRQARALSNTISPVTTTTNDPDYWDNEEFIPYNGERHDDFDWNLTKAVLQQDNKNVIVSPFSIKLLLSLLAEAAGPDTSTHRELSSVLPSIKSPSLARELYGKIFGSLLKPSTDYDLEIGTKILVDQSIQPMQRFAAIIESHYFTTIEQVNFAHPDMVADMINAWCRNITKNNIKQLVTKEDIDKAVMILLNAIYFNGYWRRPFPQNETLKMPFYAMPTKQMQTDFMRQTGNFYFVQSKDLEAKVLRIPYKGKKFAMNIILPNEGKAIEDILKKLESTVFRVTQWQMEDVEVHVSLPKFKFDSTLMLNEILKKLGIQQIFTFEASLPSLARGSAVKDRLQVSAVLQKAGIDVNERGSTAYAATEIVITNKFGGDTTREFLANRPFLFFIEDETTGTLLFAGKVTSPDQFMT